MKSLYTATDSQEILSRIESLQPIAERQWGKMDVAQMLAHCSLATQMALGIHKPQRRLLGRLLGGFFKKDYVASEKPMGKNSPTHPMLVMTDAHEFDKEKTKLLGLVKQFANGGEAACTTHPHSFFGKLTPTEWGISQYKHLDHHLRQFGA